MIYHEVDASEEEHEDNKAQVDKLRALILEGDGVDGKPDEVDPEEAHHRWQINSLIFLHCRHGHKPRDPLNFRVVSGKMDSFYFLTIMDIF